jgi:hypothetical protein
VLPVGHLAVEQLADDVLAADLLASGYKSARCRANSRTMHMPTLGQPGKVPNSCNGCSSSSSSSARAGGPTRGERREGGSGDWDSAWYKKSLTEVAEPASFENKVDQLWQSILTKLFPFQEDYRGG